VNGEVTVIHDPVVAERFPGHTTAVVRVRGDEPLAPKPGAIEELRGRVGAPDGLAAARSGSAAWREVYAQMGAKPKYLPSNQALLETYEERGSVPVPVPLVELYCWYSLAHGIPMAGYDATKFSGPLRLTVPGKGLAFTAIGHANAQPERTKSGEVAYVDDEKVVCRYWNCRDCDQTKLSPDVRDALFVFDLIDAPGVPGPAAAGEVSAGLTALLDGTPSTSSGAVDGTAVEKISLA
jgi:DNA/RNA-binding domain of Phe-tRNA-synthetase-like protein